MKKLRIISLLFIASFMGLAGCNNNGGGGSGGGGGGGDDDGDDTEVEDTRIEVNFYLDYNKLSAKEVYYSVKVENGSKLSKPDDPTTPPMPEFPTFLGWSRKEIVDNKDQLWNFSTDVVKTDEKTFNLFGIWVAEGEK